MRKLQTIILFLLFINGVTIAQSIDEEIKDIRKKYKDIKSNINVFDTIVVDFSGRQVKGYYDKENLKQILVWSYYEDGKRKIEFYFNDGQLFFVFDIYYKYNRPIFWDGEMAKKYNDEEIFDDKKTIIKGNKYYFQRGELIRWIKSNGQISDKNSSEYKNNEKEILSYADKMKKELNKN